MKLIYQFLHRFINGYLFFRYLEKVLKEEINEKKKEKSRDVTTNYIQ